MGARVLPIVTDVCITLALVSGLLNLKYLNRTFTIVLAQVILASAAETFGFIFSFSSNTSNGVVYNIYLFLAFPLLILLAQTLLKPNKFKLALCLVLIFNSICLIFFIKTGLYYFQNHLYVFGSLIISCLFLAVFISNINKSKFINDPLFLLSLAILVFYGSNIPVFSTINYLVAHHPHIAYNVFKINLVLNSAHYVIITTCFFLCKRQSLLAK